ncbi:MAG: hypothetical protein KJ709_06410 [Nanoarchaeota archaeon]|nr:hypothetical protein [Nanoarchaeota archaeon]
MRDILLIGGMGAGKTSLAIAMRNQDAGINYVPMALYTAYSPLSLLDTHPDLLAMPKPGFLAAVTNPPEEIGEFHREEMDDIGQRIIEAYGGTIMAEIALAARKDNARNVIDNISKASNVSYLKEKGLYIVGLDCSFDTQVERRMRDHKGMDPEDRPHLEEQVRRTNEHFEIDDILKLTHTIIDTESIGLDDYPSVAEDILSAVR